MSEFKKRTDQDKDAEVVYQEEDREVGVLRQK